MPRSSLKAYLLLFLLLAATTPQIVSKTRHMKRTNHDRQESQVSNHGRSTQQGQLPAKPRTNARVAEVVQDLLEQIGVAPDDTPFSVSNEEYTRMLAVYHEMVRQADEARDLLHEFDEDEEVIASSSHKTYESVSAKGPWTPLRRGKRSIEELKDEDFEMSSMSLNYNFNNDKEKEKFDPEFNLVLVKKATVTVTLTQSDMVNMDHVIRIAIRQVVNMDDDQRGMILDEITIGMSELQALDGQVTLDVTPAVQHWILDPEDNQGLLVECMGCSIDIMMVKGFKSNRLSTDIQMKPRKHPRFKRTVFGLPYFAEDKRKRNRKAKSCSDHSSHHRNGKKRKPVCCLKPLVVDLDTIEHTRNILHPRRFDIGQCGGRCPFRSSLGNAHAFLQTMMRKHTRDRDIRKSCCVPSKLSGLPILFLTKDVATGESKLDTKTWSDVVAEECGCM